MAPRGFLMLRPIHPFGYSNAAVGSRRQTGTKRA